ncbi:hypothetical protein [Halobacteriovorax sp. HLS]|uniref:hypothetical protein n=1 Tax=Halobacteriovorax sp. HLS TaxID=2234000 RepID=UPI000FD7ACEF|nr:hypothetical protein [Halobacteriovorax sp. HLS]
MIKKTFQKNILILGVVLLGFSFLPTFSYSQNSDVEYVENEDHDSEELENVIENYRKENSEMVNMLQEMNKDGKISEEEKMKLAQMYAGNMKPGQKMDRAEMLKKMPAMIKQLTGQFSRMSRPAARAKIQENIDQTPAKAIFKFIPKGVDFITDLLRSDTALISLLGMFKDKAKLTQFFIANLVTFILGFFILKKSKEASFFERVTKWFMKKGIIYSLRVGILMYFFSNEVGPTWVIFSNTFF